MNLVKSVRVGLAKNGMNQGDLAEKIGMSKPHLSKMIRQKYHTRDQLVTLAGAFNMTVSAFIALGEDEEAA